MPKSVTVSGALYSFIGFLNASRFRVAIYPRDAGPTDRPTVRENASIGAADGLGLLQTWAIRQGFELSDPDPQWLARLQILNRAAEAMHARRTRPLDAPETGTVADADRRRDAGGWADLLRRFGNRARMPFEVMATQDAGGWPLMPTHAEAVAMLLEAAALFLACAEAVERGDVGEFPVSEAERALGVRVEEAVAARGAEMMMEGLTTGQVTITGQGLDLVEIGRLAREFLEIDIPEEQEGEPDVVREVQGTAPDAVIFDEVTPLSAETFRRLAGGPEGSAQGFGETAQQVADRLRQPMTPDDRRSFERWAETIGAGVARQAMEVDTYGEAMRFREAVTQYAGRPMLQGEAATAPPETNAGGVPSREQWQRTFGRRVR